MLVDDAQWIDGATVSALAFVARRLESDPIVLLTALRDGFDSPLLEAGILGADDQGAHRRTGGGAAQRALADARSGASRPSAPKCRGNPLALVELSTALRSTVDADRVFLGSELPLTARLGRAFADRLAGLAPETRTFLRVAAATADERGLIAELLTAASKLANRQITLKVATEAKAAGFVEIDGPEIRFRHPLMRSAIHKAMSLDEQQETHGALAETFASDPDRSAWHRAAATVGTSDEVAAELDAIARRANRRGAVGVAIEATYRAAQFAQEPQRRASLLVRAATLAWSMGRANDVHRLLDLIDDEQVPASTDRMLS